MRRYAHLRFSPKTTLNSQNEKKPSAEVSAKPSAKPSAEYIFNSLKSINKSYFLSSTYQYSDLSDIKVKILAFLCHSAIINLSLTTQRLTYDDMSRRIKIKRKPICNGLRTEIIGLDNIRFFGLNNIISPTQFK